MNKTVSFDIESQIAYLTEKIKEYKKSSENNFKKSMIANIVAICLIPFF